VNTFTVRVFAIRQRRKNNRFAINKAIAVPVFEKPAKKLDNYLLISDLQRPDTGKPKQGYVKSMSALPHIDYDQPG
jgi:hypothetical protein